MPFRPLARLLTVAVTAVLAMALLPATPASAKNVKIDPRLFGLHDSDLTPGSWPAVTPGSIRLWDAGVSWADIEPQRGVLNWSRLDAIVGEANARGAEVTLVLGQTPDWADDPTKDGVGRAYMPDLTAWRNHVAAVVDRYRGRIHAYQVWNEANIVNYWAQNKHNNPAAMADLTDAVYSTVKALDPRALVIGPAFATRLGGQRKYLHTFYGQRRSGVPIWRRMDAISLNLYPTAAGMPETSMTLLKRARKQLALRGVPASKPLWNTEINYGLATGGSGSSNALSSARQASYVARTYLLNAANKVKRVHWYMWDWPWIGSAKMVNGDGVSLTAAGRAFSVAQGWMLGGTLRGSSRSALPCGKDRAGTYTCVISYKGGVKRVYWNPTRTVRVRAPRGAKYAMTVYGVRKAVKGGKLVKVNYKPLMIRSKR